MSQQEFEQLLNQAREQLTSEEQQRLADELRKSVDQSVGKGAPKSVYQALEELGVIGSITDAPVDLATNRIHMEGFGADAK